MLSGSKFVAHQDGHIKDEQSLWADALGYGRSHTNMYRSRGVVDAGDFRYLKFMSLH